MADWYFLDELRDEPVAQGDVWDKVQYVVPLREGLFEETGRILVVSHDCDIEKSLLRDPERPILVSPLFWIDHALTTADTIREFRSARYWPLTADPKPVWAADLTLVQPVHLDAFGSARRLVSMDDAGREVLSLRVYMGLSYREFSR